MGGTLLNDAFWYSFYCRITNGADNTITRYYIHGQGLLAAVRPADNVILTDQVYSYHFNPVGSTVALTDQTQAVVNGYAYDPFGNLLAYSETVPQPFKFVGQFGVMSEPNGFYYMRARYYDPNAGRFISEDPIGFGGGDVNLFVYVTNNPVILIDPSGLWGLFGGWTFRVTAPTASLEASGKLVVGTQGDGVSIPEQTDH